MLGLAAVLAAVVTFALAAMRVVGRRASATVERVRDLLDRNEARFQAMVRDSSDIMAIVGAGGELVYASPATEHILGLDTEALVGTSIFDLVHPDDRVRAAGAFDATRTGRRSDRVEFRLRHADGGWRVMEAMATNLLDDPSVSGLVISARDLTDRRRAEAELREAQERFRSAFEHAPIGMALMAVDGRFVRVNRALVEILGRPGPELVGARVVDLIHPDDLPRLRASIRSLLANEVASAQLEQRYVHHDGHPVWIAVSVSLVRDLQGSALYFVCQMEDVTERRASGEALAHQAIHDPLTGLPNRLQFVERLERELARAAVNHERIAVLFLDLDHFKVVNDSLGHSAGDRLLVAVADRLNASVRPDDIVARFGGDEFTVICTNVRSEEMAELVGERLIATLSTPVALVEGEVFVTASVGIALSSGDNDTSEMLLRNADAAMYRAKELGRRRCELFDARTRHHAVDSLRTGNALHGAIERGEMRVYYQPVVRLSDGGLHGFEALVRWEHPRRGLVPPAEFIPVAEETGLIVPLGTWVLREACTQLARWHDTARGGEHLTMSVNLSPRQLAEPGLPGEFASVLHETAVRADSVWLEITETTLMRDPASAVDVLDALRVLGLHLAVDDFGSGYSSLAYLERLPVEALKIDRAFVEGIGQREDRGAIATAIVSLARALRLRTVAEGIETADQLGGLQALGCELGQGYLFGAARPAESFGGDPAATVPPWGRFGGEPVVLYVS
jgi:diguanylate cyclase (GGDEF)-like protein/PAS domain S-box-containing protein